MKTKIFVSAWAALLLLTVASCTGVGSDVETANYEYDLEITLASNQNAPALQSYVHGVSGSQWLLFAGRTNQDLDDGGLHDLNGNYTSSSFVPWSYNENIMVYDVSNDQIRGMPFDDMVSKIKGYKKGTSLLADLKTNETIFRSSNPLVTQEGDYLYVIGGYGTPLDATESSSAYQTFNQLARIHVPSVISLITESTDDNVKWDEIFAFGTPDTLRTTGGEMVMIGDSLYVAAGHNFGSKAPNFQKYLDAVFPLYISKTDSFKLSVAAGAPISDLPATSIGKGFSDNYSTFRRRDGPIVPALFDNGGSLSEGLTFYGGVFQPDSVVITTKDGKNDTTSYLRAWNDAIYVHPGIKATNADTSSQYYTKDASYYQANLNVYSCSDIELYDVTSGNVITFLIGGIGDGNYQGAETLSQFTNSLLRVKYNLSSGTSTKKLMTSSVFGTSSFYGAESEFIFNESASIPFVTATQGATEVIDLSKLQFGSDNTVDLGYVYGGIEAYTGGPGTFGPGKSAASNKIWKVTLTRSN